MNPIWLIVIGVGVPLALAACGFALVPVAAYLAKCPEMTAAVSSEQLDRAYPLTRSWWFGALSFVCFLALFLEILGGKLEFELIGYLAYAALPVLCFAQIYRFLRSVHIARRHEHEPAELVRYSRRAAIFSGIGAVFFLWLSLAVLFLHVSRSA